MKYKKLHPKAKTPTKAYSTDAGYDLYCLEDTVVTSLFNVLFKKIISILYNNASSKFSVVIPEIFYRSLSINMLSDDIENERFDLATKIPTGIAVELPEHHVAFIKDKSGLGSKLLKVFGGVIDYGYTGDLTVCLANFSFFDYKFNKGDKVAQLVIQKVEHYELEEVQELSDSARGENCFGSSGS